ncbi:DNA repair protein complementing XP-C cells isoform X1 [Paramormyrops kingsleyae]|uniref:DNA repair protein complementing XP-C cells isoform X1 n=1 Tax=Paramormyrops kingsleyae TaxID=1676925 RepID=UPI003B96F294
MAKRKGSIGAVSKVDTKKLKESANAKTKGTKCKKEADTEVARLISAEKTTKKTKIQKSRPKKNTPGQRTSKYFQNDFITISDDEDDDEDGDAAPHSDNETAELKVENKVEGSDEDEDEEWEDVEELADTSCVVPSQPVEIEIEAPEHVAKRLKREKRKVEFETYLRRMVNRFNKELFVDMHKVHLLCLVANGMFRSRLCSDPDLLAVALSLLPAHFTTTPPEEVTTPFLCGLLKWFQATFTLTLELPEEPERNPREILERRLGSLSARDHQEMTHLFLIVLRSLRLFCRLVVSLQPIPLKEPPAKNKAKSPGGTPQKSPKEPKASPGTKRSAGGRASGAGRNGKRQRKKVEEEEEEEDGEEQEAEAVTTPTQRPKNKQRRSIASKVYYKEESSEGEEHSEEEEFLVSEEEEDSEGEATRRPDKKGKGKSRSEASQRQGSRNKGGDEEEVLMEFKRKQGKGEDEWLEVHLQQAGEWVCLDVQQGNVGKPLLCSKRATQPLTYVLAVDGDGCLKDLGCRYDPTCMTASRKRRVDQEWWEETLDSFRSRASKREQREDQELQAKLLDKPLPTSITEYKNHPLYALQRHLLKYEAIYPSTAAILGYCRGEPVYSRDCVHTLHSRDTWLKEARTVRLGEVPYKMVKGFSNRSRKARLVPENRDIDDLPLFGPWQTEEYQPPVAVDGKVPRNDYGNVYMFRPCMLPVGCVHLRLPNLHRVARKLEIDCAAAVTGFDFHGGFSHPVNDGYIVCEEHKEVLLAAWENEQEILEKKEREKREKRVLANWTLLVKGLLIRERLKRRYGAKNKEQAAGPEGLSSDEEEGDGSQTTAVDLATSWPQNRQEEPEGATSGRKAASKRDKRGQEKHLFPFEKL